MSQIFKSAFYGDWKEEETGVRHRDYFVPFHEVIYFKFMHDQNLFEVRTEKDSYLFKIPKKKKENNDALIAMCTIEDKTREYILLKLQKQQNYYNEINKDVIYNLSGSRGRNIKIYADKCKIIVDKTFGSYITGNFTDGEKTIFYIDCNGVQFKERDYTLGYLQFETASALMNNQGSNFFNENTFTYDTDTLSNEYMREVYNYVLNQIQEVKRPTAQVQQPISNTNSIAQELKDLHELVTLGILTQEEFDDKKRRLLS